jgi:hypothetical protein
MKHLLLAGMFATLASVGSATKGDPDPPEPERIIVPEGPRVIHLEPIPPKLNWGDHPFTKDMIVR